MKNIKAKKILKTAGKLCNMCDRYKPMFLILKEL